MENLANTTVAAELGLENTTVESSSVAVETPVVAPAVTEAAIAVETSIEDLVAVEAVEEAPVQEEVLPTAEEILASKCDQVVAADYVNGENAVASINEAIRQTIGEEGGAFAKSFDFKHYNSIYKFLKKGSDFSLETLVEIAAKAGYKLDIVATKIDEEIEGLSDANQNLIDAIAATINATLLEKFTSTKAGAKAELSAEKKAEKLAEKKAKDDAKAAAKADEKANRERLAQEKRDAKAAAKAAEKAVKDAEKAAAKEAAAKEAATPAPELAINLETPVALAEAVAASEEAITADEVAVAEVVENSGEAVDGIAVTGIVAPAVTSL